MTPVADTHHSTDESRHGWISKVLCWAKSVGHRVNIVWLSETLEESNLIYSHRKESVVEQCWLLGCRETHQKWALENFLGDGNRLHLDGNGNCMVIHIC